MTFVFCLRKWLFKKLFSFTLFIPYITLKKLTLQYFVSITCYNETKFIIDCVSAMPIDDLSNICLKISASSRDTKLYSMI